MLRKGLLIALVTIIIDQIHKYYMVYELEMAKFMLNGLPVIESGSKVIKVTDFFNLVMVWNRGVSFGLFNNAKVAAYQPYMLIALALVIVACLLFWLKRVSTSWEVWGIGLIIGGALGNVVDRVMYGAVADFFDFHMGGNHWPAFNIADSAICIGVFTLLIESFLEIGIKKRNRESKK